MFEERAVRLSEVELHVAVGPKSGPPLVLLHGVTRRGMDFLPILPTLTTRWQVFTVDQRGHGESGRTNSYLTADYVRDAVELVGGEFSEPVVLFGHSLGAMVACGVAAEIPEAVRAVVLEDPPFDTMGPGIVGTPFHALFSGMCGGLGCCGGSVSRLAAEMAKIRIPTADGKESVRLGDARDAAQLRFGAKCLLDLDPAVLEPVLAGRWLEGFDWKTVVTRIQSPALLMAADWTSGGMMPGAMVDTVERLLEDCTRVEFTGAGHQIHWQWPEAVSKSAIAFLESIR